MLFPQPQIKYPATGAGVPNITATLPTGQTTANFTCFHPYMNNSPPNGQMPWMPILNITNINLTGTYYNITLELNQSLTGNFSVWAQTAYHRNPASISLNTSPQIIIKRLSAGESVGVWAWGECNNVTNNQSMTFNFTWGT